MAVKFFGQFLVEKGAVSRDSLLKAIDLQEQKNLKLGEMAIAMGFVTQVDIDRAHTMQLTKDVKLGDLLIEMGLLSSSQLQDVLVRQKNTHLYIGEALVQIGAISDSDLSRLLEDFKTDQAQYISDHVELPPGVTSPRIWEAAADMTYKMITRVMGIQFRPEKCRMVAKVDANFMMAAMDLSGDLNARFILSVSENIRKCIAKAVLREASVDSEPDDVLDDTVMEFVNVVCGNIVGKASQMGVVMDINPPVSMRPPVDGLPVPDGVTALSFPIYVGEGNTMEMVLFIKSI